MVEGASNHKRAVANACYITNRNKYRLPAHFLRRNLTHILDSHERQLHSKKSNDSADVDMVANDKRNWGWDFPTTEMLKEYMNGNKPVLQLESLRLKHPGTRKSATGRGRDQIDSSDELAWLPNPQVDAIWPCTVALAVSIPKDAQSSKRQIHHESLSATISRVQEDGQAPQFDIKLSEPFYFKVDKLFIVEESGSNGGRSWKRTATAPYLLDVAIQCQNSEDSAGFLSAIENRDASAYQNAPNNEGVLRAAWEQLPSCPPNGHLLTVKRAKGHKALELDHRLELAMGWISRRDYALKTYNKVYDRKRAGDQQLPTPSASDDMEKMGKRHDIAWSYSDGLTTKTMNVKSLTCALCQNDREFARFAYLMLHCKRDHEHFDFEFENVVEAPDFSTLRATITMSTATSQPEKLDAEEDKEMNWVAPDRPFNIGSYLDGQDDWAPSARAKGKRPVGRSVREKDAHPAPPMVPSRKRPALEDVEDLPRHTPKKHRVPVVPGVTFYHTTSKQKIEQGEYVAESDDEVDESWLEQSQDRGLDELGITGAAKAFTKAFNQHLNHEQSYSSVLTRDALVRFARKHKDELKEGQWKRVFREKLEQLRRVGIIGHDVVNYCMSLNGEPQLANGINGPSKPGSTTAGAEAGSERDTWQSNGHTTAFYKWPNGRPSSNAPNGIRSASPNSDHLVQRERQKYVPAKTVLGNTSLPNGPMTPVPPNRISESQEGEKNVLTNGAAKMPDRKRGLCVCGKAARDMRGCIACANIRCIRQDFHLACVGLERRLQTWRCAECST